jgi:hypothetical protein
MTATDATAGPDAARLARTQATLRQASLGALVMLIVQFGLGVGVNLYVTLPAAGKIGDVFSSGPVLALHGVLGLLLVVSSVALLVRAIAARNRPVIVAAVVGLAAILAAAGEGFSFVRNGTNAASLGMALATGVAMLCYGVTLFLVRPPAPSGR